MQSLFQICIILVLMTAGILFTNCGKDNEAPEMTARQEAPEQKKLALPAPFQKQLAVVLEQYLAVKDALVASDGEQAYKKTMALKAAFSTLSKEPLSPEIVSVWKPMFEDLGFGIANFLKESELEGQRQAFYPLSQTAIKIVQRLGAPGESLYLQYCPMAFDNTGGNWLSKSKEVRNPYFGDAMLKCGQVTETFAANGGQ